MTSYRRPPGSEITSPLSEHLAASVMSIRAHVIALHDEQDYNERSRALKRTLRELEGLYKLIEPDLFTSDILDDLS